MLLLQTLQQFDIDPASFMAVLAALGLVFFLTPAVLVTPMLAAVTESITPQKNKSFYGKCARQICQTPFGLGLMLFTLLGLGASIALLQLRPELMSPPLVWGPASAAVLPALSLLLLAIYIGAFGIAKKMRGLHLFLGYLAALVCLATLLLGFLVVGGSIAHPVVTENLWSAPLPTLKALLLSLATTPPLWLLMAHLICTGLAAGAGLTQLWLIARRHQEDFGRDYYNFAMRYCARLALVFTLAAMAAAAGLFWLLWASMPPDFLQPQDRGILLVSFGLPLSCCLLWFCVIKSETPLRHKPGAFFACLFLYLALCAQMLFGISLYPML
jgi:hypothetical protein